MLTETILAKAAVRFHFVNHFHFYLLFFGKEINILCDPCVVGVCFQTVVFLLSRGRFDFYTLFVE